MSKEFNLFQKENLSFKEKFNILLDLLLSNQNTSRFGNIIFLGISYIQIISGFFSHEIGVFNKNKSKTDKVLYDINKILRFKDLLLNKYSVFKICIIIIFTFLILFTFYFLLVCSKIKKNSFYSFNELLINYFIKSYIYIAFNIILDLVFSNFCFGKDKLNPNFINVSCNYKDNIIISIICVLLFFLSVFLNIFIQFFYCDSFFIYSSFYSRMNCNYEIYSILNSIFFSFLLIQSKYLSKEIFLIYNIFASMFFFNFFFKHYFYYDQITNSLVGSFHTLYLWTSIFTLSFKYLNFNEKGIIYLILSPIIILIYINIKTKLEKKIFLDTPYFKITNKNYFLFYIKNIIDKINNISENPDNKAILTGIIYMHHIECPNHECISKYDKKVYLPKTNEWSNNNKPNIDDKVYLVNFIIKLMKYLISQNYYCPDMIMNLSLYYIENIGNYCQALFYYTKVKEMKLTYQEKSSFERLKLKISKTLIENLKEPNEQCDSVEDLDVTLYFKYEYLRQYFIDEINKDVHLSLDFWIMFYNSKKNQNYTIDFNNIFLLSNKIRKTKKKIENLWENLILTYNGVNDLFDLYNEYIEQINDDDLTKRDLDNLRKKNENFPEPISNNYYSILFNKDTGIIIANGDKGKEGIIEKTNLEIEKIFKYKSDELKGSNISILLPKNYSKLHDSFIERYYEIGEKKIIDKEKIRSIGKDKDNAIIMLNMFLKLFPMLNQNVFFIAILTKEKIDDIIYIDNKFIIQGMSMKLMKILNIENKLLFQDNEIPFYVICKKFVNFYKIFLQGKKHNMKEEKEKKYPSFLESSFSNEILEEAVIKTNNQTKQKKSEIHENIEINENIELEYEICLPQFLLEFLGMSKKKENNELFEKTSKEKKNESDDLSSDPCEDDENDSLMDQEYNMNELILFSQRNNNENIYYKNSNDTQKNENYKDKNNQNNNLNDDRNKKNNSRITPNDYTPKETRYNLTISKISEGLFHSNNALNLNITQTKIDHKILSNEEKEFNSKIKKYKELFETGRFNELQDLIEICNLQIEKNEYKFNFTFDKYKIGNKTESYIIRCIDNKNDYSNSICESFESLDLKMVKYKKQKISSIKPLFEIIEEEKKNILNQINDFFKLSINNTNFQNLLDLNREDINKMSMVHGQKKEEIMDDENASQTSQIGFNSDLVKKHKIEEFRANLLTNVSNLFQFKYIRILIIFILFFSFFYGLIYLIIFIQIYHDLKENSKLNAELFQTAIWISHLLGSLVSIRALFDNNINNIYEFNYFVENKEIYYSLMKKLSYKWYINITVRFGDLEFKIGKYLNREDHMTYFWDNEEISYLNPYIQFDHESFPFALSQMLSNVNSLLLDKQFDLFSNEIIEPNVIDYLQHMTYLSVENSLDNIIPNLFNKISIIPNLIKDYNISSKKILKQISIIYGCLCIIFCLIYSILLHKINDILNEGLEKITKIKIDKIEETIKKIKYFHLYLKKFIEEGSVKNNKNDNIEKTNITIATSRIPNNILKNDNNISSLNNFSLDSNNFIPLKILSFSYLQILFFFLMIIIFLITIYLITDSMIISTNKFIDFQNYIFGKILISSISILKLKCNLILCEIKKELDYSKIIEEKDIQKIIKGINYFDDLKTFYHKNYLLNACKTAYKINEPEYEECLQDNIIKSANNTDSLLKIIDVLVDDLSKEKESNINNNNYILNNGKIVPFKSIYLFGDEKFKNLENIFYKFITPVSDNLANNCGMSLYNYLKTKKRKLFILLFIFYCMIFLFCLYVALFFIDKLIRLFTISRCIFKIIPTNVISNTEELESWIENKH